MAKKVFTDESLATFVDEIKSYTDEAVSTKANSSHNHAASNITSGTLSSDRLPTVPIAKGGTGATTAAAALTNLGVTATAAELNKLDGLTATTAELNYVDGVTSNIQTQLDGKAASSHTHKYAGSSSAGGSATSANKLNTDAGSATQPVYFANGIPVKTTYTLSKSVPSDAKFTDTTYTNATTTADGLMSLEDKAKLNYTNIAYGTCSTAAATAAKVITITGNTQWSLTSGSLITVVFSETNTAESPTFNVNGTGAKNVYYGASQITTSSLSYAGYKNRPMNFMYDGTQYRFIGWGVDSNTDTKVQQNAAITTAGEYPVILAYSTATSKVTNAVNKTSTLKYNPSTKVLTAPTFKGTLDGNAATATSATSATKATQDASGNVITSTYATKTELDTAKTNIQEQLDGKAASGHTHKYAGSSSAGGAATSANKVNSSLTVKLNGGTTEGTNMFTFDGSAAKSVNITPSGIGAAASSHTHDDRYYTEAEINSKVSTLNTAINGKAASSHTHSISNVTNLQSTLDGKAPLTHASRHAAGGADPITPVDIGAMGVYTIFTGSMDNLTIADGVYSLDFYDDASSPLSGIYGTFIQCSGDFRTQMVIGSQAQTAEENRIFFRRYRTGYSVWSLWKELATTEYAVPIDGSKAIRDTLSVNGMSYPQVMLLNNTTFRSAHFQAGDDNDLYISNRYTSDSRQALILDSEDGSLDNALRILRVAGGSTNTYKVLHQGNKPSGSYTGNGSATARTVDIGGIGMLVVVISTEGMCFVNTQGAWCFDKGTNTVTYLSSVYMTGAGALSIATTSEYFNKSGITYYYERG